MDNSAEQIRDHCRTTGQRLAQLAQAAGDDFDAKALLEAARAHMQALMALGLADEAFATGVGSLLTCFGHSFNPDDVVVPYLSMFMQLAAAGALMQMMPKYSGDNFATEHLEAMDEELGALVLASYNEMPGCENLPPEIAEPYAHLAQWVNPDATFRGSKINRFMAPDILYDLAARLTALGVWEN